MTPDAPAEADMGYFTGDLTNYTKYVRIPEAVSYTHLDVYKRQAMSCLSEDISILPSD